MINSSKSNNKAITTLTVRLDDHCRRRRRWRRHRRHIVYELSATAEENYSELHIVKQRKIAHNPSSVRN